MKTSDWVPGYVAARTAWFGGNATMTHMNDNFLVRCIEGTPFTRGFPSLHHLRRHGEVQCRHRNLEIWCLSYHGCSKYSYATEKKYKPKEQSFKSVAASRKETWHVRLVTQPLGPSFGAGSLLQCALYNPIGPIIPSSWESPCSLLWYCTRRKKQHLEDLKKNRKSLLWY